MNVETKPRVQLHDHADHAFIEQYRRDGFAVLREALTPMEVTALNAEATRICRETVAEAMTPFDGTDEDLLRTFLCIHYPHKISEPALSATKNPRIVDALTSIIGPNIKSMQSMLFIKSEGKPGQAWHQDEHFIPTRRSRGHARPRGARPHRRARRTRRHRESRRQQLRRLRVEAGRASSLTLQGRGGGRRVRPRRPTPPRRP